MGSQMDGLINQTPLFVPHADIICELPAQAEPDVQGQLFIFCDLGWVWESEEAFGHLREVISVTQS